MMLNTFLELYVSDFKNSQHSFQMPHHQLVAMIIIPDNHDMGILQVLCMFIDLIEFHGRPGVIINVVEDHHKLPEVLVDFFGWADGCGKQYLNRGLGV